MVIGNRMNKMVEKMKIIVEMKNFIVFDKYIKEWDVVDCYQSEDDLECELVQDLVNQGYEFLFVLMILDVMFVNVCVQLEQLNNVMFLDDEWKCFVEIYFDKLSDNIVDKICKIYDDDIYDFVFDDGCIQNIYFFDKKNMVCNKLQVIKQFEQVGMYVNCYDVMILVNGLLLVQIELKKCGVVIWEVFNQIYCYSKESFNSEYFLFKFLQFFVILNGIDIWYFVNMIKCDKNSFDFIMNWVKFDNELIKDFKDFIVIFFQKCMLLNVLLQYFVFDVSDMLLIMWFYQIVVIECIFWKIKSLYEVKNWRKFEGGGFIWYIIGFGKMLMSFKVVWLVIELDFIDKVFFVVDCKDFDYQIMKEYQRFFFDSVNGFDSMVGLKCNLGKDDNRIIVIMI